MDRDMIVVISLIGLLFLGGVATALAFKRVLDECVASSVRQQDFIQ
jgi:hypothetical protein